MDTIEKPIERTLSVPPVIKNATEADNSLREIMKEKVVPLNRTIDAIRLKRRRLREANKYYFPLDDHD